MKKIFVIADIHTAGSFALSGVQCVVSGIGDARRNLQEVARKGDAAIVVITRELAEGLKDYIDEINLSPSGPVIIEIPGLDDETVLARSAVGYIAEALGIAM